MALTLNDIERVFLEHGHLAYDGEEVSHLEHALQTATLAERAGAGAPLVTACLLHDLGRLLAEHSGTRPLPAMDDKHEYFILPFLRGLFGNDVLEPIRLHVQAKRYLCFVESGYMRVLSPNARQRLTLQGGSFDADQAMEFATLPGAPDAIRLRRWDDQARQPGMQTEPLDHFLEVARSAMRAAPRARRGPARAGAAAATRAS